MKRSRLQPNSRYLYSPNARNVLYPNFQKVKLVSTRECLETGLGVGDGTIHYSPMGRAVPVNLVNPTIGFLDTEPSPANGWRRQQRAVLPIHLWDLWGNCSQIINARGLAIRADRPLSEQDNRIILDFGDAHYPLEAGEFVGDLYSNYGFLWRWSRGNWSVIQVGQLAYNLAERGDVPPPQSTQERLDEAAYLEEVYPPRDGLEINEAFHGRTVAGYGSYDFRWDGNMWVIDGLDDHAVTRIFRILGDIQERRNTIAARPRDTWAAAGVTEGSRDTMGRFPPNPRPPRGAREPMRNSPGALMDAVRAVGRTASEGVDAYRRSYSIPTNVINTTGAGLSPLEYRRVSGTEIARQQAIVREQTARPPVWLIRLVHDTYPTPTPGLDNRQNVVTVSRTSHVVHDPHSDERIYIEAGLMWLWEWTGTRFVLVGAHASVAHLFDFVRFGLVVGELVREREALTDAATLEAEVGEQTMFDEVDEHDALMRHTELRTEGAYRRRSDGRLFTAGTTRRISAAALAGAMNTDGAIARERLTMRETVVQSIVEQVRANTAWSHLTRDSQVYAIGQVTDGARNVDPNGSPRSVSDIVATAAEALRNNEDPDEVLDFLSGEVAGMRTAYERILEATNWRPVHVEGTQVTVSGPGVGQSLTATSDGEGNLVFDTPSLTTDELVDFTPALLREADVFRSNAMDTANVPTRGATIGSTRRRPNPCATTVGLFTTSTEPAF